MWPAVWALLALMVTAFVFLYSLMKGYEGRLEYLGDRIQMLDHMVETYPKDLNEQLSGLTGQVESMAAFLQEMEESLHQKSAAHVAPPKEPTALPVEN